MPRPDRPVRGRTGQHSSLGGPQGPQGRHPALGPGDRPGDRRQAAPAERAGGLRGHHRVPTPVRAARLPCEPRCLDRPGQPTRIRGAARARACRGARGAGGICAVLSRSRPVQGDQRQLRARRRRRVPAPARARLAGGREQARYAGPPRWRRIRRAAGALPGRPGQARGVCRARCGRQSLSRLGRPPLSRGHQHRSGADRSDSESVESVLRAADAACYAAKEAGRNRIHVYDQSDPGPVRGAPTSTGSTRINHGLENGQFPTVVSADRRARAGLARTRRASRCCCA